MYSVLRVIPSMRYQRAVSIAVLPSNKADIGQGGANSAGLRTPSLDHIV